MVHQNVSGRVVQAPIPHEHVDNGASDRAVSRRGAGSGPEFFETFASLGGAASRHPVGKRHRVHGTGAGAADRLDVKPLVLEELVKHPPGECAMRAAALQSELDRLRGSPIHPILRNSTLLDHSYLGSDELGTAGRPSVPGTRCFLPFFSFPSAVRRCAGQCDLTRINPRRWLPGRNVGLSAQTVNAPSTRKPRGARRRFRAQILTMNLTTAIVAVLGFEFPRNMPGVPIRDLRGRTVTTCNQSDARTTVYRERAASHRPGGLMFIKLGCLREANSTGP